MARFSFSRLYVVARRLLRESPVETLVCIVFTVLAIAMAADRLDTQIGCKLMYFPICASIAFAAGWACQGKWRPFYWLALIPTSLALFATTSPQGWPYGMGLLLCFILIFVCKPSARDNESFANNFVATLVDASLATAVGALLTLTLLAMCAGIGYLFDLESYDIFNYCWQWGLFLVGPLSFCAMQNRRGNITSTLPTFVGHLSRYILIPAVIIYTVILYIYAAKVFITMDLPLDGVAGIVMAFYIAALAAMLLHKAYPMKYYDWFFRWFGIISLPLLVLFWWGLCYRINAYSFTDSRIYLVLAGVLMSACSLVLIIRHDKLSFRVIAIVSAILIGAITYIPGINAEDMGLHSQMSRLERYMDKLGVRDAKTGKFCKTTKAGSKFSQADLDELEAAYLYIWNIDEDLAKNKYCNREELMGTDSPYFEGITFTQAPNKTKAKARIEIVYRKKPVDTSRYPYLTGNDYSIEVEENILVVKHNEQIVLSEPSDSPSIAHSFTISNDSIMVVVDSYDKMKGSVNDSYNCLVFTSRP